MRILHFGKYWHKDGGIETHVKSLCKGLADNGVEVVNLVSSINSQSTDFEVDSYRVVEVPSYGIYFSTSICPTMAIVARKLHKEQPFDLIHLHFPDPMSHLASMALPAAILRVISWHSDIVKQKRLLKLYRPLQYRAITTAAAIIASTSAHFSSSQQLAISEVEDKKHIIPYGMNYDRFSLTSKISARSQQIRENLANGRFVVFALGRHVEYKGFSVLLDAVKSTDVHLILGGEGPLTEMLKAQAHELGINKRVTFTGRLSDTDMVSFYHACDLFCLPSITPNEAFGLVQLEAMACGKPVICTQLNNGVNVVNPHMKTGLTVPANDPKSLSSAIELLKNDYDLRVVLGNNAIKRANDLYSLQAMSKAHMNLYSDLMGDVAH